tara:strand:+ start:62 stop:229 length:168 start_codon:yes stop_codon:yes gene_type:complete
MIKDSKKSASTKEPTVTTLKKETVITATDPSTSQTTEVRGTKRMLASKSKKATWY